MANRLPKMHGSYVFDPVSIWNLNSKGFSKREIAEKVGCSLATVYYHLHGYNYQKRIQSMTDGELIRAEKYARAVLERERERLHVLREECRTRKLKRAKLEQSS